MLLDRFSDHKEAVTLEMESGDPRWGDIIPYTGSLTETDGTFEMLDGAIHAIFSYAGKNYLCLGSKTIVIHPDISVEYFTSENEAQKSWMKVYDNGKVIYEVHYNIPGKPFVNPFDGFEDVEIGNFAWQISKYVN